MERRKGTIIALSIIAIMLIGIVAAEEITSSMGEDFISRIISDIKYLLKGNQFTIYGSDMSCSSIPDDKIYMKSVGTGRQSYWFSTENPCNGKSYYADYFRGQPGNDQFITEIYYKDGTAYTTYAVDGSAGSKTASGQISCDAGAYWENNCYIEIYCCSQGACKSNSDCSSSLTCSKDLSISNLFPELGVCRPSTTPTYKTKVYTCDSNGNAVYLKDVSYGNEYFSIDSTKNAYIKTDGNVVFYIPSESSIACQVQNQGDEKSKAISLTEDEWNEATPKMIVAAMCQLPSDCAERENYTIKCIFNDEVKDINKNAVSALKESEGDFISQLCGGAKFSWADLGVVGIVKSLFWISGGGYLYNALCSSNQVEISGTCRATEKSGYFFKIFAFFDINGDGVKDSTDGMFIFFGGIIFLVLILTRLNYGIIEYEI